MKKILFTIALALICSVASFAQQITVTHNVNDPKSGALCMRISCGFNLSQGGQVSFLISFSDANGNLIPSNNENFSDEEGNFCIYTGAMTLPGGVDAQQEMYIPYSVLQQVIPRGVTHYVYYSMLDEDNDSETILESDPIDFTLL